MNRKGKSDLFYLQKRALSYNSMDVQGLTIRHYCPLFYVVTAFLCYI